MEALIINTLWSFHETTVSSDQHSLSNYFCTLANKNRTDIAISTE